MRLSGSAYSASQRSPALPHPPSSPSPPLPRIDWAADSVEDVRTREGWDATRRTGARGRPSRAGLRRGGLQRPWNAGPPCMRTHSPSTRPFQHTHTHIAILFGGASTAPWVFLRTTSRPECRSRSWSVIILTRRGAWSRGDDHTGEGGLTPRCPPRVQVCSGVGKGLAAMLAGDEASVSEFVKAMDPARFRMFPYEPAAML